MITLYGLRFVKIQTILQQIGNFLIQNNRSYTHVNGQNGSEAFGATRLVS